MGTAVQPVLTTLSGSSSPMATTSMHRRYSATSIGRRGMQMSLLLISTAGTSGLQVSTALTWPGICALLQNSAFPQLVCTVASHAAGPPCERFGRDPQALACKANELRWCQTDLGANALRWRRWMREGRRFGGMAAKCATGPILPMDGIESTVVWRLTVKYFVSRADGLPAEHFDGILAQALVAEGWPVKRVHQCLFDHSPSPQVLTNRKLPMLLYHHCRKNHSSDLPSAIILLCAEMRKFRSSLGRYWWSRGHRRAVCQLLAS